MTTYTIYLSPDEDTYDRSSSNIEVGAVQLDDETIDAFYEDGELKVPPLSKVVCDECPDGVNQTVYETFRDITDGNLNIGGAKD
nr:hypothetical protein 12 [bacterium]